MTSEERESRCKGIENEFGVISGIPLVFFVQAKLEKCCSFVGLLMRRAKCVVRVQRAEQLRGKECVNSEAARRKALA